MSHEVILDNTLTKEACYQSLLPQLEALVEGEKDSIANLGNISAALKAAFGWWWVGFYLVKEQELLLGPFQGPVACTRIAYGAGVCGSSWEQKKSIIVEDVDSFEGHIACSTASRSEIVIPIIRNNEVIAVLDVDSENLAHFDLIDQKYLEILSVLISSLI